MYGPLLLRPIAESRHEGCAPLAVCFCSTVFSDFVTSDIVCATGWLAPHPMVDAKIKYEAFLHWNHLHIIQASIIRRQSPIQQGNTEHMPVNKWICKSQRLISIVGCALRNISFPETKIKAKQAQWEILFPMNIASALPVESGAA